MDSVVYSGMKASRVISYLMFTEHWWEPSNDLQGPSHLLENNKESLGSAAHTEMKQTLPKDCCLSMIETREVSFNPLR